MNSGDFEEYITSYDNESVIENEIDLGNNQWKMCIRDSKSIVLDLSTSFFILCFSVQKTTC